MEFHQIGIICSKLESKLKIKLSGLVQNNLAF